jgi:diguanylate cyclase (GGDEF)-like protein/PAS domain S-box-containing protein
MIQQESITHRQGYKPTDPKRRVRGTGIDIVGDVPWGTHFCQFYQTKEELADILIPYFKAGLESNEYCLWITADPLNEREAEKALRDAIPDFYRLHQAKGQIEIVPHSLWYTKDGSFNLPGVLDGQAYKATQALAKGYEGVRITINVSWLGKKAWKSFVPYEESANKSIGNQTVLSLCSYPLAKCGSSEIIDVVRNHRFALVKAGGEWKLVGGSGYEMTGRALPASEDAYMALFESTLDGMFVIDAETARVVLANEAIVKLFGLSNAKDAVGMNPLDFVCPDDRDRAATIIMDDMFGKDLRQINEFRSVTRDGRELWISARGAKTEFRGRSAGFISIRDITAQKLIERKLRSLEEEKRLVMENASEAIVVVQDGMLKFVNPRAIELSDYSEKELTSRPYVKFIHPDDQEMVTELYLKKLNGERIPHGFTFRVIGKAGNVIWAGLNAISFTWEGEPAVWCFLSDITEHKQTEERLNHITSHDALTGLCNRQYFEKESARLERGGRFPVSVMMADVDGLKGINDSLGHAAADVLLQRAATVLSAAFRTEDVVARIGDDEFAVLLPGADRAAAEKVLTRIRDILAIHNSNVQGPTLSLSIGVATGGKGCSLSEVLREADKNMHREKQVKKARNTDV